MISIRIEAVLGNYTNYKVIKQAAFISKRDSVITNHGVRKYNAQNIQTISANSMTNIVDGGFGKYSPVSYTGHTMWYLLSLNNE